LGSVKIAPSRINNTLHLYFGRGARRTAARRTPEREIKVELTSLPEFLAMIRRYLLFKTPNIGSGRQFDMLS